MSNKKNENKPSRNQKGSRQVMNLNNFLKNEQEEIPNSSENGKATKAAPASAKTSGTWASSIGKGKPEPRCLVYAEEFPVLGDVRPRAIKNRNCGPKTPEPVSVAQNNVNRTERRYRLPMKPVLGNFIIDSQPASSVNDSMKVSNEKASADVTTTLAGAKKKPITKFKNTTPAKNIREVKTLKSAKVSVPVTEEKSLQAERAIIEGAGINKESSPAVITKSLAVAAINPALSEEKLTPDHQSCCTNKPANSPKESESSVQVNQSLCDFNSFESFFEGTQTGAQTEAQSMNGAENKSSLFMLESNLMVSAPQASQEPNRQLQEPPDCVRQVANVHGAYQISMPNDVMYFQPGQQNTTPEQLSIHSQAFENKSIAYAQGNEYLQTFQIPKNINAHNEHGQFIYVQDSEAQQNILNEQAIYGQPIYQQEARDIQYAAAPSFMQMNTNPDVQMPAMIAPPIYPPYPMGDMDVRHMFEDPQPPSQPIVEPIVALPACSEIENLAFKEMNNINGDFIIRHRLNESHQAFRNRKRRILKRWRKLGFVGFPPNNVDINELRNELNFENIEALHSMDSQLLDTPCSTLDQNAPEFIPGVSYHSGVSLRRRRQRYNRTLGYNTLLNLPDDSMYQDYANESIPVMQQNPAPGYMYSASQDLPPPTYGSMANKSSFNNSNVASVIARHVEYCTCEQSQNIGIHQANADSRLVLAPCNYEVNSFVNPSVFRLTSLPRKGEGTVPLTIGALIDVEWPEGETIIPPEHHIRDLIGACLSGLATITPWHKILWCQCMYSLPLFNMDRAILGQPQHLEDSATMVFKAALVEKYELAEVPIAAIIKKPALLIPTYNIFVNPRSVQRLQTVVDLNLVPPSIRKLYNLVCEQFSDYAFVYALSAQLCQECVPMECYVYFKMTLLASLNSFEPDELRAPISLFVICYDTYMANTLMYSIGNLATRIIGPHDAYQLQQQHVALPARCNWLTASPLNLAQQGVYYVGDWNRLPSEQVEELENCIENSAVPVQQSKTFQLLESAVWTYWQPEHAKNASTVFAKFCPIFGLPIFMENNEAQDKVLFETILQQHGTETYEHKQDAFNIPNDDMRTLLSLLYERKSSFTNEAQNILQEYYIVSRIMWAMVFTSKTCVLLKESLLSMRFIVLVLEVVMAEFRSEYCIRVQSDFESSNSPAEAATYIF